MQKKTYRKVEKPLGVEVSFPNLSDIISLYKDDYEIFNIIYEKGFIKPSTRGIGHIKTERFPQKRNVSYISTGGKGFMYVGDLEIGDLLDNGLIVEHLESNGKYGRFLQEYNKRGWVQGDIVSNIKGVASRDGNKLFKSTTNEVLSTFDVVRFKYTNMYEYVYYHVKEDDKYIKFHEIALDEVAKKIASHIYTRSLLYVVPDKYKYVIPDTYVDLYPDGEFINITRGVNIQYCPFPRANIDINVYHAITEHEGRVFDRDSVWHEKESEVHFLMEIATEVKFNK